MVAGERPAWPVRLGRVGGRLESAQAPRLRQRFRQRHRPRQQGSTGSLLRRRGALHRRADGAGHHSHRSKASPSKMSPTPSIAPGASGQKGKNEGILLLLAIGDRRNRLEVGYGLEPILPDGFAGSVLREMRPALRQQRYGEALMAAAETIGSTIAKAKNVTITAQLPRRVRSTPTDSIPWPADHRRHLPAALPASRRRTARLRRRRGRRLSARPDSG